jgi:hypothetical protein
LGGGQPLGWEEEARVLPQRISEFYQLGFLTIWEIQSQLATLVLVGLVAFVSLWLALATMIIWSLVATGVYYAGRRRGLPDMFESDLSRPRAGHGMWLRWLGKTAAIAVRVWFAGLQAFVYSRTVGRVLLRPARCWRTRAAHTAILSVGLTLFGVAAAHHMLRKAGLPENRVLQLSFVGPFLNVPYRILLSAIVVNGAMSLAGRLPA